MQSGKYFKYAFGEIILVVIGILIALQINNWNESRKQREKEIVILLALKKGLESDLKTEFVEGIIFFNESKVALENLSGFYNNTKTIPNDSLRKYIRRSLGGEWDFIFNTATFENLKASGIDVISNDSLRSKISSLYSDKYPELKGRSNRVLRFYENQVCPILFDNINLFDSIFSKNDLDNLKNNRQLTNRTKALSATRAGLFSLANNIKPKVESLINDIDTELERN
ncbi:DUF6090 family protein [Polaribacter glomeratus]|uniref:DUF6090 family protein n=1 Tax=Polaribacter glomeratus TaxID=102 RepID=UPI0011B00565|nr:DUF6090 family protein [Polaribacter glomeratus]TXD65033.1 hypothetical protein ESX12_12900 [Polaribacter glomeratus]